MQEDVNKSALTPEQTEVANALTAFRPAAPRISRDALMYAAGQAAGERAGRRTLLPWRLAAGLFFSATVALALWHPTRVAYNDHRPVVSANTSAAVEPQDTTAFAAAEAAVPESSALFPTSIDADSYLHMRERVLILGMNALPSLPDRSSIDAATGQHPALSTPDAGPAWQRKIISSAGDHS